MVVVRIWVRSGLSGWKCQGAYQLCERSQVLCLNFLISTGIRTAYLSELLGEFTELIKLITLSSGRQAHSKHWVSSAIRSIKTARKNTLRRLDQGQVDGDMGGAGRA